MRAIDRFRYHFGMQAGRIETCPLMVCPGSVVQDAVKHQRNPLFVSEVGESRPDMIEKRHDHVRSSTRT